MNEHPSTVPQRFVLAHDVELVVSLELGKAQQLELGCEAGDFILDRKRQRTPSKLINGATALLLEQFRTPRDIVKAVVALSGDLNASPHAVLEIAVPVIETFVRERILLANTGEN